jgi:hypothetical protein
MGRWCGDDPLDDGDAWLSAHGRDDGLTRPERGDSAVIRHWRAGGGLPDRDPDPRRMGP